MKFLKVNFKVRKILLSKNFGHFNYLLLAVKSAHNQINIKEFGFINGVNNVNWPPYRDSKSER